MSRHAKCPFSRFLKSWYFYYNSSPFSRATANYYTGTIHRSAARPSLTVTVISVVFSIVRREAALSVILIKGGLELNARQLRRHSSAVIRLALLPCIAEALAAAVVAHYVLPDFSWEWGLALGWVLIWSTSYILYDGTDRIQCRYTLTETRFDSLNENKYI